jgi:hypothetical protein
MSTAMNINIKAYIYKTYCRPTLTYGWDLINMKEVDLKLMQADEGIFLKRILALLGAIKKWYSLSITSHI